MKPDVIKIVCQNKKAYHDYLIEDTYDCGIVLTGTEIKSIRLGKVSIQEAYCQVKNNEMLIYGMHISPYDHGNIFNHQPDRIRTLLLNKKEILRLMHAQQVAGYTLVPLNVHLAHGLAKVTLGVAKGKKLYDKREDLKKKDQLRQAKKEDN